MTSCAIWADLGFLSTSHHKLESQLNWSFGLRNNREAPVEGWCCQVAAPPIRSEQRASNHLLLPWNSLIKSRLRSGINFTHEGRCRWNRMLSLVTEWKRRTALARCVIYLVNSEYVKENNIRAAENLKYHLNQFIEIRSFDCCSCLFQIPFGLQSFVL